MSPPPNIVPDVTPCEHYGRRKRILFIHHAHDLGGALRSLAALISRLDKEKYEPIVATPARPGSDQVRKILEAAGAVVTENPSIRPFHGSTVVRCETIKERLHAIGGLPILVHMARRLVKHLNPDIVHLNSTCVVGAAIGAKLANPSTPTIAHVREPLLPNRWGRILAELNHRAVDHFISIDQAGLRSLARTGMSGSVIHNFVNTETFRQDAARRKAQREIYGWRDDEVVFVALARITPANGALEFARAVTENSYRIAERARFVIAGFEKPYGDYQKKAFDAVSESARFEAIPFVNDVVALIDAADVIVAPFCTPHSARCILEGAAMGKPGLVTRLPNLQELICENVTGLSYDLGDNDALVEAVNLLCDDNLRRAFSVAASDFGIAQFGAEANAARTVAVYERLLHSRKGMVALEVTEDHS